jgi:hypothetical protein
MSRAIWEIRSLRNQDQASRRWRSDPGSQLERYRCTVSCRPFGAAVLTSSQEGWPRRSGLIWTLGSGEGRGKQMEHSGCLR